MRHGFYLTSTSLKGVVGQASYDKQLVTTQHYVEICLLRIKYHIEPSHLTEQSCRAQADGHFHVVGKKRVRDSSRNIDSYGRWQ